MVPVLAANLLYCSHAEIVPWPEAFLRLYIEDAIGERVWVEHPECKLFTDNIITAFSTILPPSCKAGLEGGGALACPSPPTGSSSGSRTPTRPDDEVTLHLFNKYSHHAQVQIIELPINRTGDSLELEPGVMHRSGTVEK